MTAPRGLLDLVADVAACPVRVTSLMTLGGRVDSWDPIVQDPELAVIDDHGDDLAAVAGRVDLDSPWPAIGTGPPVASAGRLDQRGRA